MPWRRFVYRRAIWTRQKRSRRAGGDSLGVRAASIGIKPAKPLRILIVQAEDDEGDIIEMAQIIGHLGLSEEQKAMVHANTRIEFVNDATGNNFLDIVNNRQQPRSQEDRRDPAIYCP
jgi:hypothetical protein